MKIIFCALICAALLMPLSALAEKTPVIGILIYNGSDAFMAGVFETIEEKAEGMATIKYLDSKNSQILQNEQVETLLKEGVDALIVNAVDRTAAIYLIRRAILYDVPIVFINREPLYEDLKAYHRAYYVGNDPKESGILCGEMLIDYFAHNPGVDKNGDGVIQYVMLKGELAHQDTVYRSSHSIKTLQEAGYQLERLAQSSAMWERTLAQEAMSTLLATYGDSIECVISNNDEMALGAIEALKAAGYFTEGRVIPVVGVDATDAALQAIKEGTLLGTVLNDSVAQGDAALRLAVLLAGGEEVSAENYPYEVDREHIVWIQSRIITSE